MECLSLVCFDDNYLNSPLAYSDSALNDDTTFTAESVCNKLYELIYMLERQQQELKYVSHLKQTNNN